MQILTYFFKLFFCGLTLKLMVLYIICIWKILRKGSGWAGAMCSDVLWIFLSFLFLRMILSCFSSQHNSLQNSILIVIFFFYPVTSPLNPTSLVWHQNFLQSDHYFPIHTYCLTTPTLNQVQMDQFLTTIYKFDISPNNTDFPHSFSPKSISKDLYWCLFRARLCLEETYSAVGDIDNQKGTYDSSSECSDYAGYSVKDHREDMGKSVAWVIDMQPRHGNAWSGWWWMCRERHTKRRWETQGSVVRQREKENLEYSKTYKSTRIYGIVESLHIYRKKWSKKDRQQIYY